MLGLREEQKQRTRARILAAARKLFADPGYDETTIRMIAAEAGVAPGSVFTTFESKEDVLFAITGELFEEIAADLAAKLSTAQGSVRTRLKGFLVEVIVLMRRRMPLMMVHFGLSWRWSSEIEADRPGHVGKIFAVAGELLREAVRNGEIAPETDLTLLAEVLTDVCVRNLRRTWYRQLDDDAVAKISERQVDLVFDGACGGRSGGSEGAPTSRS